jgi:hypothetical protein
MALRGSVLLLGRPYKVDNWSVYFVCHVDRDLYIVPGEKILSA